MESRILSLAALTVLELSPPDMVEAAARAGYSHVGLRLVPATVEEHHYPLLADAGLRRRTLARLRDSGVRTLDVEILRLRPDTRVGEFAAVLEVGAEFGARYVLVAGNDDDERRSADNFAALCDLARPLGLDPHLEFMPWTGIRDLRQAARVVEAAARDNAGLLLDAFHFDRSASSLEDLRAIPPVRATLRCRRAASDVDGRNPSPGPRGTAFPWRWRARSAGAAARPAGEPAAEPGGARAGFTRARRGWHGAGAAGDRADPGAARPPVAPPRRQVARLHNGTGFYSFQTLKPIVSFLDGGYRQNK